jgi:hypothetical protein
MRYTPDEWGNGKAFYLFDWIRAFIRARKWKKKCNERPGSFGGNKRGTRNVR